MAKFLENDNGCNDSYDTNNILNRFRDNIKYYINNCNMFATCFLNISNFKYYNYMFDYEFGNLIIESVFSQIKKCTNSMGDVYRYHGDVILIILHKIDNEKDVKIILDKIIDTFRNPIEVFGREVRLLINIGISLYPNQCKDINSILKYTEIALTYAKKLDFNSYKFFQLEMYEKIINRGKLEIDLVNALDNKEFILFYQPQIDIKTMRVYGMEALLRWNHPIHGILPPMSFIETVEQSGIIKEIGKFVFKEACNEIIKLSKLGFENLNISINVSEKQLEDDTFVAYIEDTLNETKADANFISIEITERILVNPSKNVLYSLSSLRDLGIKIYIDDFGTQYSSLNYLCSLPVDGIKIDKTFIDRIQYVKKEFIITKNIVNLANELNLDVVAEGVEHKCQVEKLTSINCTKIQGFIFGEPVSSQEFIKLLKSKKLKNNLNREVSY